MKLKKIEMNELIEKAKDQEVFTMDFVIFANVEALIGLTMHQLKTVREALVSAALTSDDFGVIQQIVKLVDFFIAVEKEAKDKFEFRIDIEKATRKKHEIKKED